MNKLLFLQAPLPNLKSDWVATARTLYVYPRMTIESVIDGDNPITGFPTFSSQGDYIIDWLQVRISMLLILVLTRQSNHIKLACYKYAQIMAV